MGPCSVGAKLRRRTFGGWDFMSVLLLAHEETVAWAVERHTFFLFGFWDATILRGQKTA